MDLLEVLSEVSVVNRDNGSVFTDTGRLDVIESLLRDTPYRRINADGLFHLYSKLPPEELKNRSVVVVSSHVDCARTITRCFSEKIGNGLIKGVYDNAITNAAVLYLMLEDKLPDDCLAVFTGDEEVDSQGALDFSHYAEKMNLHIVHLYVLDVTGEGWDEECDFTIENNFWHDDFGRRITELACHMPYKWRFVPSDEDDVPFFVLKQNLIPFEAAADESWEYDEENVNCCSICIPTEGEMHSNNGILARERSLFNYTDALRQFLNLR